MAESRRMVKFHRTSPVITAVMRILPVIAAAIWNRKPDWAGGQILPIFNLFMQNNGVKRLAAAKKISSGLDEIELAIARAKEAVRLLDARLNPESRRRRWEMPECVMVAVMRALRPELSAEGGCGGAREGAEGGAAEGFQGALPEGLCDDNKLLPRVCMRGVSRCGPG